MISAKRVLKVARSAVLAATACTLMAATTVYPPGGDHNIVRLAQVTGDGGKTNDIVFCGHRRQPESNVIFFTGDVQDFKEKMMAHRDNHRYAEWDVESSAALLLRRFPSSHIWVVKAARMDLGTFSIYSNFVNWNTLPDGPSGPVHFTGQRSWYHLRQLMENAVNKMNSCSEHSADTCTEETAVDGIHRYNVPVIIVGFSKGCVVLNQLAYDRPVTLIPPSDDDDNSRTRDFVKLATEMFWLDGGHAGGQETWVTDVGVLRDLAGVNVHSHVTPYQIKDGSRPWIGKEQRRFITGLTKYNVSVTNTVHFSDEPRSLENHFRVLEVF